MTTRTQKDIDKLYDHARVANEEMSTIKSDVNVIKLDVAWIKKSFDKHTEEEFMAFKMLHDKIDGIKLGIPQSVVIIISIIASLMTGLMVYLVTH